MVHTKNIQPSNEKTTGEKIMTKLGLKHAQHTLRLMKLNLEDCIRQGNHKAIKNKKADIKRKEDKIKKFYTS